MATRKCRSQILQDKGIYFGMVMHLEDGLDGSIEVTRGVMCGAYTDDHEDGEDYNGHLKATDCSDEDCRRVMCVNTMKGEHDKPLRGVANFGKKQDSYKQNHIGPAMH
ncbi:hypothetical protein Tco_0553998 [Tanacetum coccineum]